MEAILFIYFIKIAEGPAARVNKFRARLNRWSWRLELQEAFSFSIDEIMGESFKFCQPLLLGLDDVSCSENTYQRLAEKDEATAAALQQPWPADAVVRRAIS